MFLDLFDCKYMVYGKEVGASGTPHLQGFVQLKSQKTLSSMIKCFIGHIEVKSKYSTFEEAINYCKKDGDWKEKGTMPKDHQTKGIMEAERWELALDAYEKGRYDEVPADIGIRYGKGLEQWSKKRKIVALQDTDERMEWYYGPSGSGKSRKARTDNPTAYLKMCNKWWDGYEDHEVAIIEDFDISHKVLVHHLKIWGDRYPFPAEVKGNKIDIRPKKIIITSNYHPNEIWTEKGDLEPILRRFKLTRFDLPYSLACQESNPPGGQYTPGVEPSLLTKSLENVK